MIEAQKQTVPRDALERWIAVLLTGGVLVLMALSFVADAQFQRYQTTVELATKSRLAVQTVQDVTRALLNAETGQRGYLLTSQMQYLEPYRDGEAAAKSSLTELRRHLADDPAALPSVEKIERLAALKLDELASTIALHGNGSPAEALAVVQRNDGKRWMDEVRSLSAQLVTAQQTQLSQRASQAELASQAAQRLFVLLQAVLVLTFSVAFWLIRTELRKRRNIGVELQNSQADLRANERRTKAMADSLPALISYTDADQTVRFANSNYERFFGAAPDSLIGKTALQMMGASAYEDRKAEIAGVLAGQRQSFERITRSQGRDVHLMVDYVPDIEPGGAVVGWYAMAMDISELRRKEQLLAQSEAQHRAIVEEQTELVALSTASGELLYVNPAFARLYEETAASLMGRSLFDFVPPAEREAVRVHLNGVLHTGQPSTTENRIQGSGEHQRLVSWCNSVQSDAQGRKLLRSVGRDITEQRLAEEKLRASEDFLTRTGRVAGVGGWAVDLVNGSLSWSAQTRRIHEVLPDFVPTLEGAIDFYAPESKPLIEAAIEECVATGKAWDLEMQLITATGRQIWVRTVGDAEFEGGKAKRLVGAFQDITERKRNDMALEQQERMLRTISDNLPVFIAYVDATETVRFLNATGKQWLRVFGDAAENRSVRELLGERHYEGTKAQMRQAMLGTRLQFETATETRSRVRHVLQSYVPDVQADGSVAGVFVLISDITEMKERQQQLDDLARTDTLTGLPNRRQFDEKLREAALRSQRDKRGYAVMFLDIDHFKRINDTLGHASGDAVLREFGQRLTAAVRETDVAARLAGDEFVVLLGGVADEVNAARVAQKILDAVRLEFTIDGHVLQLTTSVGIALSSDPSISATDMVRSADAALYQAKGAGRNRFHMNRATAKGASQSWNRLRGT